MDLRTVIDPKTGREVEMLVDRTSVQKPNRRLVIVTPLLVKGPRLTKQGVLLSMNGLLLTSHQQRISKVRTANFQLLSSMLGIALWLGRVRSLVTN
jgi:hypothetical protein